MHQFLQQFSEMTSTSYGRWTFGFFVGILAIMALAIIGWERENRAEAKRVCNSQQCSGGCHGGK